MSTTDISFQSSVAPPVPIHRFTVEEYHALGEQGVLGPEDRVELLEGLIVKKMNQLPPHSFVVQRLSRWLYRNVHEAFDVRCQLPITLSASEPEPDLAVVGASPDAYRHRHPSGNDCRLLIEVADTSLARDLGKAEIYASAGVKEYWIVKIANQSVLRMHKPGDGKYGDTVELYRDDTVEFTLGEHQLSLPLKELFPA